MDLVVDKILTLQTTLGMEPSYRGDLATCGAYTVHDMLDEIEAHIYQADVPNYMHITPEYLTTLVSNPYFLNTKSRAQPFATAMRFALDGQQGFFSSEAMSSPSFKTLFQQLTDKGW